MPSHVGSSQKRGASQRASEVYSPLSQIGAKSCLSSLTSSSRTGKKDSIRENSYQCNGRFIPHLAAQSKPLGVRKIDQTPLGDRNVLNQQAGRQDFSERAIEHSR